jgi:hypothetical protein
LKAGIPAAGVDPLVAGAGVFEAGTLASMLPMIFLSGFVFPIRSMPFALQFVTYLLGPGLPGALTATRISCLPARRKDSSLGIYRPRATYTIAPPSQKRIVRTAATSDINTGDRMGKPTRVKGPR